MGFYIDRILKLLNMVWLRRGGGGLKGSRLDTFQTVEVEELWYFMKKTQDIKRLSKIQGMILFDLTVKLVLRS